MAGDLGYSATFQDQSWLQTLGSRRAQSNTGLRIGPLGLAFTSFFSPLPGTVPSLGAYFTTFEEDQSSSEELEVERMKEVLGLEVGPRSVTNAFIFVTVLSVGHCPEEK